MIKYSDNQLEQALKFREKFYGKVIFVSGFGLADFVNRAFSSHLRCIYGSDPVHMFMNINGDEDFAICDIGELNRADAAFYSWMFAPEYFVSGESGDLVPVEAMHGGRVICPADFVSADGDEVSQIAKDNGIEAIYRVGNKAGSCARIVESIIDGEKCWITSEISGIKYRFSVPVAAHASTDAVTALLALSICGGDVEKATLEMDLKVSSPEPENDNVIDFGKIKHKIAIRRQIAAFKVIAVIDMNNEKKTAFLGRIDAPSCPGKLNISLPSKLDQTEFIYTGMKSLPLQSLTQLPYKEKVGKRKSGGEISSEVLIPGDIVKVINKNFDNAVIKGLGEGVSASIKTIRAVHDMMPSAGEPEYAL